MKYKIPNSEAGFTLVEEAIYMGIFGILLVVLMQIFTSIIDVHLESQATSSVAQDGSYIMARLTRDVRFAQGITFPAYGTQSTSKFQVSDANGAPIYTYNLSGGNLTITDSTNIAANLNSSDTTVTAVNFTNRGNDNSSKGLKNTVGISITLKSNFKRVGNNITQESFTTTVGTR